MKTRILIIIGLVFSSFQMMGFENAEQYRKVRAFEEPIYFVENNIEFYVFSNGDFDFNALPESECYYKNGVKYEVIHDAYSIPIRKDYYGRITSIGNVPIKYLRNGKVSRIGEVRIRYQNHNICQIGHLTISVNPFGHYHYKGYVNRPHHHYYKKHYKHHHKPKKHKKYYHKSKKYDKHKKHYYKKEQKDKSRRSPNYSNYRV
ncbi:hypothetical protein [Aureivirga marina]|uniref:hypothetical protein n=1 Tax=Aureivirga marina TaxID=1182451 RepID=UPI0018CACCA5|nr:hypothetical protein [Aureivirga marina]